MRQAVGKTRLLQVQEEEVETHQHEKHKWRLEDFELGKPIAKGCAAVVFSARLRKETSSEFPFAIKMMFNYHAESNAFTILRAMHRETVPAQSTSIPPDMESLCQMLDCDKATVAAHPK